MASIMGGIAAVCQSGATITNCVSDMQISGNDATLYIGGICGRLYDADQIRNCVFKGAVANNSSLFFQALSVGGIVGTLLSGDVRYCSNEGQVLALDETTVDIGGIIGKVDSPYSTVEYNASVGKVGSGYPYGNVGGIIASVSVQL